MIKHVIEVTPTVSASAAYTAADQVGGIMTLSGAAPGKGAGLVLNSVIVTDKDSQDAALDLFFFDSLPTVASSDNAEADVADAELVGKCIGHVSIAAADYKDLKNGSVGCIRYIGMSLKPDASQDLYCVAVTSGTPTYTSTSALTFKFVLDWE